MKIKMEIRIWDGKISINHIPGLSRPYVLEIQNLETQMGESELNELIQMLETMRSATTV